MRVECVWLEDKSVAYTSSVRLPLCKEWSQWICQCHTTWNILRNLRTKYSVLTTYLTEGWRPCKYKQSVCVGGGAVWLWDDISIWKFQKNKLICKFIVHSDWDGGFWTRYVSTYGRVSNRAPSPVTDFCSWFSVKCWRLLLLLGFTSNHQ